MEAKISKKLFCSLVGVFFLFCLNLPGMGTLMTAHAGTEKELVVQTWGGLVLDALTEAYFKPFTKETGVKVVPVSAGADQFGKITAQVRSGNIEWDLIEGPDYPTMENAAKNGLLEPIDYEIVTDTKDLIPGSVKKWAFGMDPEVAVITYNHKRFPGENRPRTWKDFFDVERFPGPRTMPNWGLPHQVLAAALLADGVSPEDLIPIDFERAFHKLDQIKPHVRVWYTGGDQSIQTMLREEAVIGMLTDGRAKGAKELGVPLSIEWNQGLAYICYWAVVKGAPHKTTAMEFLNFACRPELQATFTKIVKYTGVNRKLLDYLDPSEAKDQCIHPDNWNRLLQFPSAKDASWVTSHSDEITERWNSWLSQ